MLCTNRKEDWFEVVIPEHWSNYTVQELFKIIWNAPKKQTHQLRMDKKVLVNGQPANWTEPLKEHDLLAISFFSKAENKLKPFSYELSTLYEDDHLLIINKPAGMDTHPNSPNQYKTLANAVSHYLSSKGEYTDFKHIQRLDHDTSGAILFAKHPFVGALLDQMLEKREIKRTYLAIVHGIISEKKGIINQPIGSDRHHATRRRVSPGGQAAVTKYEVLKTDNRRNLTYIKCNLETGRTHQIRVHFSYIRHPLAGDTLYGGKSIFPRQALHSVKLEMIHPLTEEPIVCFAPFHDGEDIFTDIDPYQI